MTSIRRVVTVWGAAFLTAICVPGCGGSRQPMPPGLSPSEPVPAGMADCTVINASDWTLMPGCADITDNGALLARLKRSTFKRVALAPGEHVLSAHHRKLSVRMDAGGVYHVIVRYNAVKSSAFPFGGDPVSIRLASLEEGNELIRQMTEVR